MIKGRTAIAWAASSGDVDVLKLLLPLVGDVGVNKLDKSGDSPLWLAIKHENSEVVSELLCVDGIHIDGRNDEAEATPLMLAALLGHARIAELLLGTGRVDVNAKDNKGLTALHRAAGGGHRDVASLLLENSNIDANSRDDLGQTALHHAVKKMGLRTVKVLVNTISVDVDAMENSGQTALAMAIIGGRHTSQHREVIFLLEEAIEERRRQADIK